MRRLLGAFDALAMRAFYRPVSALPLACLRVAFGVYLLFYAAAGHATFALAARLSAAAAAAGHPLMPAKLLSVIALPEGPLLQAFPWMFGGFCLAAAALALGVFSRVAAVYVWVTTVVFTTALAPGTNTGDQVVCQAAFLVMLAALAGHAQATLSLDSRRRRHAGSGAVIPVWPVQLLRIQLVLIYFYAGFLKWTAPEWYKGEAMYYILAKHLINRMDFAWLWRLPALLGLLTYGTVVFECFVFPFGVFVPRLRRWVLFAGLLFHAGIDGTMRIPVFSQIMLVLYVAFLEPRDLALTGLPCDHK